jgi:integrase
MTVVLLTDRFVRTARPLPGQRQTEYFDESTKGLSLVASAGARTFYLTYTVPKGAAKAGTRARMKLGSFPDISLADARQKARDARAAVTDGSDPVADRRTEAAALRVRDLVESYIARQAKLRSGSAIARRLRKNVAAVIGDIKLAQLHRRDITHCIDAVTGRGAPTEANRLFEDVRAMVRWARGRGDLDDNLMEGMQRPADLVERDRVLTPDEIKTFWTRLPGAVMEEGTRRVLRLCLVTAARVGEVAGMTALELDLERQLWKIPAARSKNKREHILPLSDLAVEIIRDQLDDIRKAAAARERRLARQVARRAGAVEITALPAVEWVFPGPGARAPVTVYGIVGAIARNREHFGLAPFTSHDLRRTAATRMTKIGVLPFIVSHILGHVSVTKASVTSKHYDHNDYLKEQRAAVNRWDAHLRGIVGDVPTATVLPLFERR